MNAELRKVSLSDLPDSLARAIDPEQFISAAVPKGGRSIIFWLRDMSTGHRKEFEFSLEYHRVLSEEEREKALPPAEELFFQDLGIKIERSYFLERNTDVMHERFDIIDLSSGEKVDQQNQLHYIKFKNRIEDVAKIAANKRILQQEYAGWSEQRKVNYWATRLYQMRRQVGEQSGLKELTFDQGVLLRMKNMDANVESILLPVLKRLAVMEQCDEQSIIHAFCENTGWRLRN